jgi:hypothetical protein
MTTLEAILSEFGINVNLTHILEFDETVLSKDGFKPIDQTGFTKSLQHSLFEKINVSKHQNEVDIYLNSNVLKSNKVKIDFLTKIYSLFQKELNLTEVDLENYHKDFNDILVDTNISIGIHHEIINFNLRITLENK